MTKIITDSKLIEDIFGRYTENIYPSKVKAEEILMSGNHLSFYMGIDPTGPDIHLGHTTNFFVLKKLIDLGHKVILLIGDFTAQIGDPTGKDTSRKPLSEDDIKQNMATYIQQASKILPKNSFEVKYNSQWLNNLTFKDIIKLSSHFTVQQIITRDMYQRRLEDDKPIGVHEFLYPLAQGYDSVAMEIDGEIGGNDQTFNMLVGRDLSKALLHKDKIVITTRLLEDPASGKKIMSKSEGRYISLNDEPREIRRKVLALEDQMTKVIFELCTEEEQILISDNYCKLKPREFKELLANKLIEMYYPGENKVQEAHQPKEINQEQLVGVDLAGTIKILGFASSVSSAKNLINSNAVEVNGELETNWKYEPKKGDSIKVGKGKFALIK